MFVIRGDECPDGENDRKCRKGFIHVRRDGIVPYATKARDAGGGPMAILIKAHYYRFRCVSRALLLAYFRYTEHTTVDTCTQINTIQ